MVLTGVADGRTGLTPSNIGHRTVGAAFRTAIFRGWTSRAFVHRRNVELQLRHRLAHGRSLAPISVGRLITSTVTIRFRNAHTDTTVFLGLLLARL